MKSRFIIFISLVFLFVVSSVGFAYDKEMPTKAFSTTDAYAHVKVLTSGVAEGLYQSNGKYYSKKTPFLLQGSGFIYKPGVVLTAAHVITPDTVNTAEDDVSFRQARPIYIHSQLTLVVDSRDSVAVAGIYHINHELDYAILVYHNYGILKAMSGDSMRDFIVPEQHDVVCAMVRGRDEGGNLTSAVNLHYGKIVATEPFNPFGGNTSWWNPWDITLSVDLLPGDSGSPLFVFEGGKPVLIGICRAGITGAEGLVQYTYAVLIPGIDRFVSAFLNNQQK